LYAVIVTGGKQYKVQEGEILFIERLDKEISDDIVFDNVLVLSDDNGVKFGTPNVEGATVSAKVISHGKDKKIIVFKYRPKKDSKKKQGHRQPYTKIQIEKIKA